MSTSVGTSGSLRANQWTKVLWGWGWYSVNYNASIGVPGGQYRSYSNPFPFPIGSGPLPARITHSVYGYGDVWLFSPADASYQLIPVGRETLSGWPNA
jgi:hypothetical protein